MKKVLLLTLITFVTVFSIKSATINVPADQANIQAAIDIAVSGDTVLVAAGTYPENLTIGQEITLLSSAGAALTIIDGSDGTSCLTFTNNVSNNCLAKGCRWGVI